MLVSQGIIKERVHAAAGGVATVLRCGGVGERLQFLCCSYGA